MKSGSTLFVTNYISTAYKSPLCIGLLRLTKSHTTFAKCSQCRKSQERLRNSLVQEAKRRRLGVPRRHSDSNQVKKLKARVAYLMNKSKEEVKVNFLTSNDLVELVKIVEAELAHVENVENLSPQLAEFLKNADLKEVRESLRKMRVKKEEELQKSFSVAQQFRQLQHQRELSTKNDKKRLKWPALVLNVAIAIYQHSTSAYSLLKKMGILLLPSARLMRSYCTAGQNTDGADMYNLASQVEEMKDYARRTNHKFRDTEHILKGFLNQDEMQLRSNACVSKTSGEWRGFAEQFNCINDLCCVYDPNAKPEGKLATHVTATLWSSFLLPFQILVSSRATNKGVDNTRVYCLIMEAYMAVTAFGLEVPLLILDAASANRSAMLKVGLLE